MTQCIQLFPESGVVWNGPYLTLLTHLRDHSLITGRWGATQRYGGGGGVRFYPYINGVRVELAMVKEGGHT